MILSVCPPHAALDVAWVVHGFTGLYVDANAIAPGTAREVAQLITDSGGRYVDGGIIGGPPVAPGAARLYLSGADAPEIAALFGDTALETRVVNGSDTAASAVKMAYASWTKGSSALLLAARALAQAEGVEDALLAEWELSQPQLPGRLAHAAQAAVTKGWRWVGEMEEIAASMAGPGCPTVFIRRPPRSTGAARCRPTRLWCSLRPGCARRSYSPGGQSGGQPASATRAGATARPALVSAERDAVASRPPHGTAGAWAARRD